MILKYDVQQYFNMATKFKMLDFVWMCRCVQGQTVYIYDEFCGDGALYVEVIRT